MLLETIKKHSELSKFIHSKCEDEGICIDFDNRISQKDVLVIKVDDFYNNLKLSKVPASPDCLIVQKCRFGFAIYIVELKGIKSSKGFVVENMLEKFSTCIDDFICKRFKDVLEIDYKRIKLYFVSKIEIYKHGNRNLLCQILIHKSRLFWG